MKVLALVALAACGLGGCTIDQTLSTLQTSSPAILGTATTIVCSAAPAAEAVAGTIESGVAPNLATLNNIAQAGTQVACERLTAPVVAQ